MTTRGGPVAPEGRTGGYHEGELAVQRRAGVSDEASRLVGMLTPTQLRGGTVRFLSDRTFAVLTARDRDGRLWVSPLAGAPGFLTAPEPSTLSVRAVPDPGDPLSDLPSGQQVGILVIDFATRRRVRINGRLLSVGDEALEVEVRESYGNCPQYIQQRQLAPHLRAPGDLRVRKSDRLARADIDLIRGADTFFIGTTHPSRGADASHRGGPPGFVRVHGNGLWWPDYAGNNMFNTLGNLSVAPDSALLFVEFRAGAALHLSGTATVTWTAPGTAGDDDATGRLVQFPSVTAAPTSGATP